jgi:hypothetical protein
MNLHRVSRHGLKGREKKAENKLLLCLKHIDCQGKVNFFIDK